MYYITVIKDTTLIIYVKKKLALKRHDYLNKVQITN